MSRALSLLFAVVAYGIFFATFLYLIGFVGNLPYMPRTVDAPPSNLAPAVAGLIDLALVALFGLQHSSMARQGFKRAWTRVVSPAIERSIYVLFASLALIVLFLLWQPIEASIWNVPASMTWLRVILWGLFALGFTIVLISTFLINHFELFGLQQAWFNLRQRQAAAPELRQPLFYRWVAHPLYAGFFLAFWSTPTMTAGHLLLALAMSAYMLFAIRLEERDLTDLFGARYTEYRGQVGMLTPRFTGARH
ncbi:MAG: methanethiol S-methyltransferase [Sphingomonas sp.]